MTSKTPRLCIAEGDAQPLDNAVTVSAEDVRVSYYETDKALLCLAANMKGAPSASVRIGFPVTARRITDAEADRLLAPDASEITVDFDRFDYRIFKIEK